MTVRQRYQGWREQFMLTCEEWFSAKITVRLARQAQPDLRRSARSDSECQIVIFNFQFKIFSEITILNIENYTNENSFQIEN